MSRPADLLNQAQHVEDQHRAAALARRLALPQAERCVACQSVSKRPR